MQWGIQVSWALSFSTPMLLVASSNILRGGLCGRTGRALLDGATH
jgi:hypothetical protein